VLDDRKSGNQDPTPSPMPPGTQESIVRPPVTLESIYRELEAIKGTLSALVQRQTVKDWYTPAEAAALLGKEEFTVREWCRNHRINAEKQKSGRGPHRGWAISHDEILRYQREGLLPDPHTL
jgi:hypothetical protein